MVQQNYFQICIQQNFKFLSAKSFFPYIKNMENVFYIKLDKLRSHIF